MHQALYTSVPFCTSSSLYLENILPFLTAVLNFPCVHTINQYLFSFLSVRNPPACMVDSRECKEEATENHQQHNIEGSKQAWEDPGKWGLRRRMGFLHEGHGILQDRHGWTSGAPRGDQSHQAPSPLLAPGAPWPQLPRKPQLRVEGKKSQCDITEDEENEENEGWGLFSRTVCSL